MRRRVGLSAALLGVWSLVGCQEIGVVGSELSHSAKNGKKLFKDGTFGGNGRTCATCHDLKTGTFSLEDAQERLEDFLECQEDGCDDCDDPLFRPIDSDDGTGASYNELVTHGTVTVEISFAANVSLASDPSIRSLVLRRSVPSTNNIALEDKFMLDGREPDLETQALNALIRHSEITDAPDQEDLEDIVAFQVEELFSPAGGKKKALEKFADGGPAPQLPEGKTAAEKRGRKFFERNDTRTVCAMCHSGPMLNEVDPSAQVLLPPPLAAAFPPGFRFANTFVSQFNATGQPVYNFTLTRPDGSIRAFSSPDPGRALITGQEIDINRFKIPTVWNISETAPYMHDGSVETIDDVMPFYLQAFTAFRNFCGLFGTTCGIPNPAFTAQEMSDITAFLKLL
jgi:cytochrome c peroxidase